MQPVITSTYMRVLAVVTTALIVGYSILSTNPSVTQFFAQPAVRWVAAFVFAHFLVGIIFVAGRSFLRLRHEEQTYHKLLASLMFVEPADARSAVHDLLHSNSASKDHSLLQHMLYHLTHRHAVDLTIGASESMHASDWTEDYRSRVLRHVLKPLQNWSRQLFLLGFIFTILGVCMTLSNTQILSSAEEMREYIPTALGGLGVAFVSSIIAYCGSLCLDVVSNSYEHGIDALFEHLSDVLMTPVLPVLNAELALHTRVTVGGTDG